MWVLKQKLDGTFCLFYDRHRRFNSNFRGLWEFIGQQGNAYTDHAVRVNRKAGYLCCNDSEGGVRVLVLED